MSCKTESPDFWAANYAESEYVTPSNLSSREVGFLPKTRLVLHLSEKGANQELNLDPWNVLANNLGDYEDSYSLDPIDDRSIQTNSLYCWEN
jgi:hypothetical protein